MRSIVRWTIGDVQPAGYECLARSIIKFRQLYDVEIVVCHNGSQKLEFCDANLDITCINQSESFGPLDAGVAWKLYPPRIDIDRHELFIDNDVIIEQHIEQLDKFFSKTDCTLLLEGESRNYGRFEKHVPPGFNINSGIFGIPPGFNLEKYIRFYGDNWVNNCFHTSKTWDEQGLVATALLSNKKTLIIPNTTVTNCESRFKPAKGMHFVGLNRRISHRPWVEYKNWNTPLYL